MRSHAGIIGAAGGFSPASLSGLSLWLQRGVGITGSPISAWADQSGAGVTVSGAAVEATGGNQPAADSLGSFACPKFDGTSKYLDAVFSSAIPQPYTVMVCGKYTALGSQDSPSVMFGGVASPTECYLGYNGPSETYAAATGSALVNHNPIDTTSTRVYSTCMNGALSQFFENGTLVAYGDQGSVAALGSIRVGAIFQGGFNMNGWVRELLVYNRVLTDLEQAAVANYLSVGQAAASTYQLIHGTLNGNIWQALIPSGTLTGLILYSHGYEGGNYWGNALEKQAVISALLAAGYAIAGGNQGGNGWGNTTQQMAITDLRTYLIGQGYSFPKTAIWGQSAGGVGAVNVMVNNSWCSGFYGVYPAVSLDWAHNTSGNSTFITDINNAYPSGFSGFDPCALPASAYAGKRLRTIASSGDTIVNKAANATALITLASSMAIEAVGLSSTGDHGDNSNFLPSDVVGFFNRC
jgi:hypothetical protein